MLDASQTSKRLHKELGLHFNRTELMTNFLLAFNWQRNHDGAAMMVELLSAEPSHGEVPEGLIAVYAADWLNETGQHEKALEYAQRAGTASDPLIRRRSKGEAMIAQAGLGKRNETIALMHELGFWSSAAPTPAADRSEAAIHARALLAASAGDATQAVALQNKRLDLMIGNLRDANAADAAALLSHLENSRERQLERESALQREAESASVIAQQRTRLSYMLMAIVALIGSALVASVFFLRYRERVNSERIILQKEALSAEKMKTEFLGLINHELRTPLNGVIGISDALIHHSPDSRTRTQAKAIQESGEQLFELIESMIDMTTLDSDKAALAPHDTQVAPFIKQQIKRWTPAADDKGLQFTHFIDPALDHAVFADGERIGQVCKILLSNATRFTTEGRIHLHATTAPEGDDGSQRLTIVVADTGQGISEHVQSRLFKPFLQADSTMTRKHGGAGLSLAIGRKLAEMMDGTLDVVSNVGRGSEFTFTARLHPPRGDAQPAGDPEVADSHSAAVNDTAPHQPEPEPAPIAASAPAPDPAPDAAPAADALPDDVLDLMDRVPELFAPKAPSPLSVGGDPLEGLRLLVVEDLPSNQDVIRLMVEPLGCHCTAALDANSALAMLGRQTFDAVLMDIRMPDMDGIEATRRIRAMDGPQGDVPVIVLTADAAASTNDLAMEAGANAFLAKPVLRRALVAALRDVLAGRAAA